MPGRVLIGDCRSTLAELPAASVHCCVTSPPYYGLRNYGEAGQVGLEGSPDAYVQSLVAVFRAVRRVLRPDGALWLNLGDCYVGSGNANHDQEMVRGTPVGRGGQREHRRMRGIADGNLLGIPWRVALALQRDGWLLRSEVVWSKANPLPESVAGWRWERCRRKVSAGAAPRSREQGYSAAGGHRDKRHGNLEDQPSALWEDCGGCQRCGHNDGLVLRRGSWRPTRAHEHVFLLGAGPGYYASGEEVREGAGRNLRDVWEVASSPSRLGHCATMSPEVVDKCVRAGCPARACARCGAGHAPVVRRGDRGAGLLPTCGCGAAAGWVPGVVRGGRGGGASCGRGGGGGGGGGCLGWCSTRFWGWGRRRRWRSAWGGRGWGAS